MANVTALHGAGGKQGAKHDAVSKSVAGCVVKSPPSSLGEHATFIYLFSRHLFSQASGMGSDTLLE